MSNGVATGPNAGLTGSRTSRAAEATARGVLNFATGLAIMAAFWWLGGYMLSINPKTQSFAGFGLIPTLQAFPELWQMGKLQKAIAASGYRLGSGLLIAIVIGVPIGIIMGRSKRFRDLSNSSFQFLRMISPLSWMPIAVFVFAAWDNSIIAVGTEFGFFMVLNTHGANFENSIRLSIHPHSDLNEKWISPINNHYKKKPRNKKWQRKY